MYGLPYTITAALTVRMISRSSYISFYFSLFFCPSAHHVSASRINGMACLSDLSYLFKRGTSSVCTSRWRSFLMSCSHNKGCFAVPKTALLPTCYFYHEPFLLMSVTFRDSVTDGIHEFTHLKDAWAKV